MKRLKKKRKSKPTRRAKTPDTLRLLRRVVTEWREFDRDEEVPGADLVDWFGEFRAEVKKVLKGAKP